MNSRTLTISLLAIIAILLIAGSSAVFYIGVYQPGQVHAQATATVAAVAKGVARANATSTAQVRGTTESYASATASTKAQATSIVSATQIAFEDVYNQATSGTPVMQDALTTQDANNWDDGQSTDSSNKFLAGCSFANGGYDAQAISGELQNCQAKATNFGNLTYEVQIKMVHGHSGGSVIRADANGNGYNFRISTDGSYIFKKIQIVNGAEKPTSLAVGQSSFITIGSNQSNILTVIAKGNNFTLYINHQYVAHASDNTYKSGQVGVYIDSDASGVEAVFQNAKVWKA